MIQYKQPKKVKGARKRTRDEAIERLRCKFPTWFENKTEKEIRDVVNAFRHSGKSDDEFPVFCMHYESLLESISKDIAKAVETRRMQIIMKAVHDGKRCN